MGWVKYVVWRSSCPVSPRFAARTTWFSYDIRQLPPVPCRQLGRPMVRTMQWRVVLGRTDVEDGVDKQGWINRRPQHTIPMLKSLCNGRSEMEVLALADGDDHSFAEEERVQRLDLHGNPTISLRRHSSARGLMTCWSAYLFQVLQYSVCCFVLSLVFAELGRDEVGQCLCYNTTKWTRLITCASFFSNSASWEGLPFFLPGPRSARDCGRSGRRRKEDLLVFRRLGCPFSTACSWKSPLSFSLSILSSSNGSGEAVRTGAESSLSSSSSRSSCVITRRKRCFV